MAPGPTDLEAWEALQAFTADLDKVRKPKDLKEAMHEVVSRSWNMTESRLDFVDFGVIWIDPHFRQICNKFAKIGPGRETFSMAIYRTLKTSRLEGYWDVLLENLADWIELVAKEARRNVTLDDYERLLGCVPADRNLKAYRLNIKNLFWLAPGQRASGFLSKVTAAAYEDIFDAVVTSPPEQDWNLRLIMNQIHDKAFACKSVMLHVGFWFNPGLEEPANRSNMKPPMFHHLKPAFSKYASSHPMYEADDSWKPQALGLQRVVLKVTIQKLAKGMTIIGNLGMLRDMSPQRYRDYITTEFWNTLLHEVRNFTNAPFQLGGLTRLKHVNDLPPLTSESFQGSDETNTKDFRGQVRKFIRETYDEVYDRPAVEPEEDGESLEGENDSVFVSQYAGRDEIESPLPEDLAVESEDDPDIMHVQTPSPANSNQSKRRKVRRTNEELGYVPVYDEQNAIPQKLSQKVVTLKMRPKDQVVQLSQDLAERPRNLSRKRGIYYTAEEATFAVPAPSHGPPRASPAVATPVTHMEQQRKDEMLLERPTEQYGNAEHPSTTGLRSQKSEPAIQPATWEEGERARERETARRALDECEGNTQPPTTFLTHASREDHHRFSLAASSSFPRPGYPAAATAAAASGSVGGRTPPPNPIAVLTPSLSNPSTFHAHHIPVPAPASPGSSSLLSTNKTEQAIRILQDGYAETLTIEEMLAAIRFLKSDLEAGIFLTLKPGQLRNAWLWEGIKDDVAAV